MFTSAEIADLLERAALGFDEDIIVTNAIELRQAATKLCAEGIEAERLTAKLAAAEKALSVLAVFLGEINAAGLRAGNALLAIPGFSDD